MCERAPPGASSTTHEVGGQLPAVGDWVAVTPPATIASILPRRSAFIRKNAGQDSTEQVLATNVDAAFLLAGLDDDFSLRRLERYITIAWESGAQPIVVLTKADLALDVAEAVSRSRDASRSACRFIRSRTSRVTGSAALDAVPAARAHGRAARLFRCRQVDAAEPAGRGRGDAHA